MRFGLYILGPFLIGFAALYGVRVVDHPIGFMLVMAGGACIGWQSAINYKRGL
jgi:hypothetical protein